MTKRMFEFYTYNICADSGVVARLLELRVRIPPVASLPFFCECCDLSGRGPCDCPMPHQEKSYRVCVRACVRACACLCHSVWSVVTINLYT